MSVYSWREVAQFVRFAIYSFLTFASIVGAWIALDLPRVASQGYVDLKFQLASDSNRIIQSQMTSVRIQLNRMTRQSLESEKYRLTKEPNQSFDTLKRIKDIEEELEDAARERMFLLKP